MERESETREAIRNALNQMSPNQREVFIHHHYKGLMIREIAEKLGMSEGAVKVHHHRAIRKLKEILSPFRDNL